MDKSVAEKIKLGVFIIVGLSLFIAAIYFIGQKQSMFGNTSKYFAVFSNVNGLKPGNNVRYSGINAGTVTSIDMINDTSIIVGLTIEKEISKFIMKDAKTVITTDGLVGNMIINILPGANSSIPVENGDTLRSFSRVRTDEMLNTLSVTNENAALLTAELLKITKDITSGKGLVGAIIKDSTLKKDFHSILDNVNRTSNESALMIRNLNRIINGLNDKNNLLGTIKDTAVANQVENIVSNIEASTKDIRLVIRNLDKSIENMNKTVLNVKDGKGAINYLSNDQHLVTKIDRTMSHVDSTVNQLNKAGIRLNENLEALKHNWLLRGYFKKLEKQKQQK